MDFLSPTTWGDALQVKAQHPDAVAICGGTDVMVEVNFDHRRPGVLLDLTRIRELREWGPDDGRTRLGSAVTYTTIIDELAMTLPGLAIASRTVGSPQIRNRGTIGGNLGAASPAGDSHPVLLATDTIIEVESVRGVRQIPIEAFYTGVKRHALEPDELIKAIRTTPATGPQQFCKIGTRNAMVISVASFSFALHTDTRTVGTGIGSAAPTPLRAVDAGRFLADALEDLDLWDSCGELPTEVATEFGEQVKAAAAPIDDVRGTATYRLHALSVMARRAATWAWDDYRRAA